MAVYTTGKIKQPSHVVYAYLGQMHHSRTREPFFFELHFILSFYWGKSNGVNKNRPLDYSILSTLFHAFI